MNSNHGKDLSNIVQHIEIIRKSGHDSLMSINRMDYVGAELHFLTMDKELKKLLEMIRDLKRSMEEDL